LRERDFTWFWLLCGVLPQPSALKETLLRPSQQLVPVVQQMNASSAATQWNAFLRVENFEGCLVDPKCGRAPFEGHIIFIGGRYPLVGKLELSTMRGHIRFVCFKARLRRRSAQRKTDARTVSGFPRVFFFERNFNRVDWPPPATVEKREAKASQNRAHHRETRCRFFQIFVSFIEVGCKSHSSRQRH